MRKRTAGITIRVTAKEKEKLEWCSRKCGMNLSSYLRNLGLGNGAVSVSWSELLKIRNDILNLANSINPQQVQGTKESLHRICKDIDDVFWKSNREAAKHKE